MTQAMNTAEHCHLSIENSWKVLENLENVLEFSWML